MIRLAALSLMALALGALAAHAEHADIDLRIIHLDPQTGQSRDETSATADTEPPAGGRNPRPLARVRVGESLALQFVFINTYPHGVKKNVNVRYVVVREEKPRQKTLPDLEHGVVTQGTFTLNFKPKGRVGARVEFTLPEAGFYLLRVESIHTDSDHEHFSAIDLQAE